MGYIIQAGNSPIWLPLEMADLLWKVFLIQSLKKYFKVIQKEPKTKWNEKKKKKSHSIVDELCALKWWTLEKYAYCPDSAVGGGVF